MSFSARWIDRTTDLVSQVGAIGPGPLALDTEADSFHHYHDKVCLIQISHPGGDALIDPLAGLDVAVLREVLEDPAVPKLMHGADYDLRILDRDFALRIRGLFDTMMAARLLGHRAFGLAALLESELRVSLDKKFQRADWSRRPLPDDMRSYAVEDTRHLRALASRLRDRLVDEGRLSWAEEEFARIEKVRWTRDPDAEANAFRRVKGAAALDRRQLAVLEEVFAVRERIARERDLPRFRILRDEVLLQIVRTRTGTAEDVASVRGLPRPLRKRAAAEPFAAAVRRALDRPEGDLPEIRRPVRRTRNRALESRVKTLRSRRDEAAARLGLEPQLLATGAVLEAVAGAIEGGGSLDEVEDLRAWQRGILEATL